MAVELPITAKPEVFMPLTLALVRRRLIIPEMITRVSEDFFKNKQGDTVTFRVEGLHTVARKYTFRSRTDPIVLDDISGGDGIPVTLDIHTYSATGLTDEQMTLDNLSWTRHVMVPQAEAVANDLENDVVDQFAAMETRQEIAYTHGQDPFLVAVDAQRRMDNPVDPAGDPLGLRGLVPSDNRYWLMGSNVAASVAGHPRFSQHSWAGTETATTMLRRAQITAPIAGFIPVKSMVLDPDESWFFHKTSLILGTVAPSVPRGATTGFRIQQDGFGMRWIADYDAPYLRDRSVVSMFSGLTPVYDERLGGTGTDRHDLRPLSSYTGVGDDVPKSFRAIKVNYTPPADGDWVPDAA
jgi:hypothetical protein